MLVHKPGWFTDNIVVWKISFNGKSGIVKQSFSLYYSVMKRVFQKIHSLVNHPALGWLQNRYVLSGLLFLMWMLFLDTHSLKIHYKLYKEIRQTRKAIEFYKSEIEKDKQLIDQLESNPKMLERFAREQYYFKKPNEAIFIVELVE